MSSQASKPQPDPQPSSMSAGTASTVVPPSQATVDALFESLNRRGREPSLDQTTGIYEFDIAGSGKWFLRVSGGVPSLQEEVRSPDCVIACDTDVFVEVAEGKRNLVSAFLAGDVQCAGDLALAVAFRRLVPVTR